MTIRSSLKIGFCIWLTLFSFLHWWTSKNWLILLHSTGVYHTCRWLRSQHHEIVRVIDFKSCLSSLQQMRPFSGLNLILFLSGSSNLFISVNSRERINDWLCACVRGNWLTAPLTANAVLWCGWFLSSGVPCLKLVCLTYWSLENGAILDVLLSSIHSRGRSPLSRERLLRVEV